MLLRFIFRFSFVYWSLFIVPLPPLWLAVVPWVGRHLFHVNASVRYWFQAFLGAGDSTFHYVQVFCAAALAMLVALLWMILDRRRSKQSRLHLWLRLILRFYLAAAMVAYGGGKLIPDQFPLPPLDALVRPVGQLSGVELLWIFMGASPAYTIFTGIAEMAGGLLLTTRRTTLLGALICAGVMANVFMLNLGYDVPVKILSFHLLAMSLYLLVPDAARLANWLIFNRPASPSLPATLFARPWLNRTGFIFRTFLVTVVTALSLLASWYHQRYYGDWAPRPPLYGIWDVDEFKIDGQIRPPLLSDSARWRRTIFPEAGICSLQFMDDSVRRYTLQLESATRSFKLSRGSGAALKGSFTYEQPQAGLLTLEGDFEGHKLQAKLHDIPLTRWPLEGRRLRWVHEPSYER